MRGKQNAIASVALAAGAWLASTVGVRGLARPEVVQATPAGFELGGGVKAGAKIYKEYCQKCHGKKGNGQGLMAKDLDTKPRDFTDKNRMGQRTDYQIFLGIKEGGAAVELSEQMTGWKDTLNEQEMRDVAAYIRQFAK
jgi:mono/diheme cytochrome c family protein